MPPPNSTAAQLAAQLLAAIREDDVAGLVVA